MSGSPSRSSHVSWAVIGQLLPVGFSYVGFIVMVGTLSPSVVGTFALALLATAFLASFGDLGLGVALLRRQQVSRRLARQAFRWTLATGVILTLFALGGSLAVHRAGFEMLAGFLLLLSGRLLLDGISYIPTDVAQRHLRFRFLTVRDSFAGASGAVVGIASTSTGYAEWCLAMASIAQGVAIAAFSPWAMRGLTSVDDGTDVQSLIPFASRITAQQVFKYLTQTLDALIVGVMLGNAALGQYRVAQRLGIETSSMVRTGIGAYLLPELTARAAPEGWAPTLLRVQRALLAISGALAVLIGTTSAPLLDVLLGEQWLPAADLLSLMCVVALLQTFLLTVGETMKAAELSGLLLCWTIAVTVVISLGLAAGSWAAGLSGLMVAYVGVYLLLVPVGLRIQHRLSGVGMWKVLAGSRGVLLSLLLLAAVATGVRAATEWSPLVTLAVCWGVGGLTYGGAMLVLDRATVRYVVGRGS